MTEISLDEAGWIWGGNLRRKKDPMHLQFASGV